MDRYIKAIKRRIKKLLGIQPKKKKKKPDKQVRYANYYETLAIEDHVILYECFHGKNMSDSPLAIFKALVDDPNYQNYTHVFVLNKMENCKDEFKDKPNVVFCKVNSDQYLKTLASAKYLINNTTFPPFFVRKENQIYVNTWHGTPLKTLGKDMKGTLGQHKNIQRNFLQATHLINPNRYTSDVMIDSHDLRGLYNGYVTDCGYPRIDLTLKGDKEALREVLHIDKSKQVVLYAPTWRGEVGQVESEIVKFIDDYKLLVQELGATHTILLRVHSLMYKHLKDEGLEQNVVPEQIDTNELLGIVDVLITDYSSIMFDFMATKKPLVFYAYDREEYEAARGTYLKLEDKPGEICKTIEEVIDVLQNIDTFIAQNKNKYETCLKLYCPYDDGQATQRAIDFIFHDDHTYAYKVTDDKTNILMYCGGFLNNGITSSAINLLNNIDYDKYNVVVIDKSNHTDETAYNFSQLNDHVKKLYRVGKMSLTKEESARQKEVFEDGLQTNLENEPLLMSAYIRENKRLLGDAKFDVAIDFSGYVKFWTMILAVGDYKRKVIYQHNDMMAEYHKVVNGVLVHQANMKVLFPLYESYDTVVSVAQHTKHLNAKNLEPLVPTIKQRINCIHNSIEYHKILESASQTIIETIYNKKYLILEKSEVNNRLNLSAVIAPTKETVNFVNVGRLSPEKDQKKLIEAFNEVAKKHDNVLLYILGDGVLREELEDFVRQLNLGDKVMLLGQVKNPFAVVNACDCFVLSSNHEGQPMVLLESLVLGKSIIATDIAGNRSILEAGYGDIVENSVEGLVNGMENYIVNKPVYQTFDYKAYNQEAMRMFYKIACGHEV